MDEKPNDTPYRVCKNFSSKCVTSYILDKYTSGHRPKCETCNKFERVARDEQ